MSKLSDIIDCIVELYAYERAERQYRLFYSNDLPIPQPVEVALSSHIAKSCTLSTVELTELRQSIHDGMADALIVYAARMASLAIRCADFNTIKNGLIAITLDDDLADPRDVLAPLCLLCDAAIRLDRYDSKFVKAILSRATPNRLALTSGYVDSRVGITTPTMMGFLPTGSAVDFLYLSTA